MRQVFFALILASLAFTQASPDEEIDSCRESCCRGYGGEWDGSALHCAMDEADSRYDMLSDCQLQCVYGASGVDTGLGACLCAPALMLAMLCAASKGAAG